MTKLDPTYHLPINLDNRIQCVFFIEAVRSNPNGDPATGGAPRYDAENHGIISNASIKRVIRDYAVHEGQSLYVARGADLEEQQVKVDKDPTKAKNTYWDLRPFGGVLTQMQDRVCGAVQFSDARSVNEIQPETVRGTRVGGHMKLKVHPKKGKKAGEDDSEDPDATPEETMGANMFSYEIVPYGLYMGTFTLDPFKAKANGLTEDDMSLLYAGLIEGLSYAASAHRTGMALRRMYVFSSPTARGTEPSHMTRKRVKAELDEHVSTPLKFEDYQITVDDNLPAGMSLHKWVDGKQE